MISQARKQNDPAELWLRDGRPAWIAGHPLRPLEHPHLRGVLLGRECGQAVGHPMQDADGGRWFLKRFIPGRMPDRDYLESVASVLPSIDAVRCGTERLVLMPNHLERKWGSYYRPELAAWIDGAVLMPQAAGQSWASVADDIRAGKITFDDGIRLQLLAHLAATIHALEQAGCAHTDLSPGNLFVDPITATTALIDFDGVYHASLPPPGRGSVGTEGYIAPFAWSGGQPDRRTTWTSNSDRFALAVLAVEILVTGRGSPCAGDGGLFEQAELCVGSGAVVDMASARLGDRFPDAAKYFATALHARDFSDCPAPKQWQALTRRTSVVLAPSRAIHPEYSWLHDIVSRLRQRKCVPTVLSVNDLPNADLQLPMPFFVGVALPPDPWTS